MNALCDAFVHQKEIPALDMTIVLVCLAHAYYENK